MPPPTLLVATPSCDVYGSDLQMLQTVRAAREDGWRVVVTAPATGPLAARLDELGAELRIAPAPVLRRSLASPAGLVRLVLASAAALPRMVRLLRSVRPDAVLVNTITLPLWPLAARLARVPAAVHVHEAEDKDPALVRKVMALPLLVADRVVMNSATTAASLHRVTPALRRRSTVVSNGVEEPPTAPRPLPGRTAADPLRLVAVGRLTARKGVDVALEAVALLRGRGHDVRLELAGTPAPGGEEFAHGLAERAARPDLAGAVELSGYASPVWPVLERADVVLAPSLGESFGNAVVEAQLAGRPVVATGVQGHLETVVDGSTGLLVPPADAAALADAVERLAGDPGLAVRLAEAGRRSALDQFTAGRYRREIMAVLRRLAGV